MPHGGGEVGKGDGSIDLEHVFPWESDADSEIVFFFFSGFGNSTAWNFFFFFQDVQSYFLLVGGLEHFLCFHILGILLPFDFHIFQRGRSTTNQSGLFLQNQAADPKFLEYFHGT